MRFTLILILSIALASTLFSQESNKKTIEKAVEELTKQIELKPKSVHCFYERALLWIFLVNEKKIKEDIEQLRVLENEGWMYHHVCGLYAHILGDTQLAIEHFDIAIKLNKSNIDIQIQKAQIEILNNNTDKSIKTFEELKATLEQKIDECSYNLAGVCYKEEKYKEALKYLDQIKIPNFNADRLKGKVLIEKGEFSKGVEVLILLSAQHPNDKELATLIIKYHISAKKFKVAIEILKNIIIKDPLGEDLEIDEYMFKEYLSGQENKELSFKLISYLIDKGNYKEAKYLLKRAIRVEPLNEKAKSMLESCK